MMRIVLPVEEGCLSHSFEDTLCFDVFSVRNHKIIEEVIEENHLMDPEMLEQWFVVNGITDVIAFKIRDEVIKVLNKNKINVFVGVEPKEPKRLVRELISGTLVTNGKIIRS
ncbi:MAG: hypothetical protein JEZ14_18425 [Marinilabiliaceae bacterium]|nr:hypothetical protein [Marinilabiliaceae bacterium]